MVALLGMLLGCHFLLQRQQTAYSDLSLPYSAPAQAYDAQGSAEPTEPSGVSVTVQGNPENE